MEIAGASHPTVVVSAPGLGDDIQAIKAGLLEVADVHVVSKSDRSDAWRTVSDLQSMLALGAAAGPPPGWIPPVVAVSDGSLAATLAHGVLLGVGAEMTSRRIAQRAVEQLEMGQARFLGAVLNRVVLEHNAYYYSRYYGHQYKNYYAEATV